MITVETLASLRSHLAGWRSAGERIGFVPTMGNLHAGHIALVKTIQPQVDRVVVSIFVNPTQFGPDEDYDNYPRTLDADRTQLEAADVDLVYLPVVETMYGENPAVTTRVQVPELTDILCGATRPGHFDGVTTIVARLFNQVMPDTAIFGEKDYQQLAVIRRMVKDLCFPIEIMALPTQREPDGLALSSRHAYLSETERQIAPQLYQALQSLVERIQSGRADFMTECENVSKSLENAGFSPEYVEIRRQLDLMVPSQADRALVVLAAARLGQARLIDNLSFEVK